MYTTSVVCLVSGMWVQWYVVVYDGDMVTVQCSGSGRYRYVE